MNILVAAIPMDDVEVNVSNVVGDIVCTVVVAVVVNLGSDVDSTTGKQTIMMLITFLKLVALHNRN